MGGWPSALAELTWTLLSLSIASLLSETLCVRTFFSSPHTDCRDTCPSWQASWAMPSSRLSDVTTPRSPREPDGRVTSAPGPGTPVARPASSSQGDERLRPFPARVCQCREVGQGAADERQPVGCGYRPGCREAAQGRPHMFLGTMNMAPTGSVTAINQGQRLVGRTLPPAQALCLQL